MHLVTWTAQSQEKESRPKSLERQHSVPLLRIPADCPPATSSTSSISSEAAELAKFTVCSQVTCCVNIGNLHFMVSHFQRADYLPLKGKGLGAKVSWGRHRWRHQVSTASGLHQGNVRNVCGGGLEPKTAIVEGKQKSRVNLLTFSQVVITSYSRSGNKRYLLSFPFSFLLPWFPFL